MRSVHLLGLGVVAAVLALLGCQWQEASATGQAVDAPGSLPEAAIASSGGREALSLSQSPIVLAQAQGDATRGQQIFQQSCAGCHSIGGGRRAGPDLQGVGERQPREWIIETIVDPAARHARGDPTARELQQQYGMQMPDLGITEAQALDILAHIAPEGGAAAPPSAPAPQVQLPPGDPERGRALFLGAQRLQNGGPGCIACHDIAGVGYLQGGTWARDLGGAVGRLGPEGFAGIVQSAPFPAMSVAYGNGTFADQELGDLVAFVSGTQSGGALPGGQVFPMLGLIAFGVMAGASHLIWRGRARQQRQPGLTYRRY